MSLFFSLSREDRSLRGQGQDGYEGPYLSSQHLEHGGRHTWGLRLVDYIVKPSQKKKSSFQFLM